MRDYVKIARQWQKNEFLPQALKQELKLIIDDEKKIKDAFAKELEFGTSGLRGIMGVGCNRMNSVVIARVTKGLAMHIKTANIVNPKVAIAYDSRLNSYEFAKLTAEILENEGIEVILFEKIMPVSLLSYAVKYKECDYGVMITASHNPKEYNGYKVYNSTGGQILEEEAKDISVCIKRVEYFEVERINHEKLQQYFCNCEDKNKIEEYCTTKYDEVCNKFYEDIHRKIIDTQQLDLFEAKDNLKIIYSPLNGTGLMPVTSLLKKCGFKDITVVEEQKMPDGTFPTIPKPNPEYEEVYEIGRKYLQKNDADILIVTDPDSDRIGVATNERVLTGNQLAVLLFDYLCEHTSQINDEYSKNMAYRSIVSTPLVDEIAGNYNVEVDTTLIGFKYIADKIENLQREEDKQFLFGFEEGNGYLAFDNMRDKDGVSTALLTCLMAQKHKSQGQTIEEALNAIYKKYGYYRERVVSYRQEGIDGIKKREDTMKALRSLKNRISGEAYKNDSKISSKYSLQDIIYIIDYKTKEVFNCETKKTDKYEEFPSSNILEFGLFDGSKFIVRPSGTEPILKTYMFTNDENEELADKKLERVMNFASNLIKTSYLQYKFQYR